MLTSRELATVIIVIAVLTLALALPSSRKSLLTSLQSLIKSALHPKLLSSYLAIFLTSAISTAIAWRIGLWDSSLLKEAILLTLTVTLPMTFRSMNAKSGGSLVRRITRETISLAALIAFYIDTVPLPLGWEIIYQLTAIVLVMIQAVGERYPRHSRFGACSTLILICMGLSLLAWTTISMLRTPPNWHSFFQSLLFSFWLPITMLPFFYLFSIFALAGQVFARFRAIKRPPSIQLRIAVLIGARFRLGLLSRLNGRYNHVSNATGFRDGLVKMQQFRADLKCRSADEAARLRELSDYAGISGVGESGRHFDRREFGVTKECLEWIWVVQNGQYNIQGGRYWDHMTDSILDLAEHDLPAKHGFFVEVTNSGQVWRAWRRTPGGAVLAIGGRQPRTKFYYQGENPPATWPGSDTGEWFNAEHESGPPDWSYNDNTRV